MQITCRAEQICPFFPGSLSHLGGCCFSLSITDSGVLNCLVALKHSCEQQGVLPALFQWCSAGVGTGSFQMAILKSSFLATDDGCHRNLYPKGHSKHKAISLLTLCAHRNAFAPTYLSACNRHSNCSWTEMSWVSLACRRRGCWEPPSGIPVGMTVLAWVLQTFMCEG